ncbi:TetR/AcrR family transcriptional regulator [Cryptosporangium phraense]|uniref:TetR/AcrR family transcriptional regulator n=1 Tax=Cryptosporangium phraense TaxID=2593070 RepID=UPI00197ADA39|nr:TetR/AcrR family transcriptional regulator [Cryptosporangium phraense]
MEEQDRRERILAAARAALERHEYEQIQMRDVAQGAGVALGTLYRCFSSKEHLYAAVLLDWLTDVGRAPAAGVRARAHAVIAACQRRPQFYKAHVALQSSADPNARALLTASGQVARAALAAEVAGLGPARADDAATMLWALITSRLSQAIYRGGDLGEIHRIADAFVDLLAPRRRGEQADRS